MLNSLNEPTRCRNHSRATKIGQRMWKRNALCSNGEPWRSRIRKRIRPSSDSSISVLRRANETRAPFTTERSSAIAPSSRTKPWSRTSMVLSEMTSCHGHGRRTLLRHPDGTVIAPWRSRSAPRAGRTRPGGRGSTRTGCSRRSSSSFYAQRFDTVELNSTGYRLPSADQFRRWADAVPDGFEFAVKFSLTRLDRVTTFLERVLALGDRLGPVRVVYEGPRDDGTLSFVLGSIPEDVRLAFDFRARDVGRRRRRRPGERSRRRAVPLPPLARAAVHRRRPARGRRDDPRPGVRVRPARGRADRARDRRPSARSYSSRACGSSASLRFIGRSRSRC